MKYQFALVIGLAIVLMLVGVGCERKVVYEGDGGQASLNSCFTCHGDDGLLLAAQGEWQNSIHASGNNVDYTNRGEGDDCTECHDHQGFVDLVTTGSTDGPYDQVSSIHCFTCHAPHTRGDLTLRESNAYTLADGSTFDHGSGNLCANCHHARQSVNDITDDQEVHRYWGPHHGPQADLVNASNGYEFDGYEYGNTGHGAVDEGNSCIGCHMGNPQTHIGYKIGGHSFNMSAYDESADSIVTLVGVCNECHPSADNFDYEGIQTNVETLLDDLEALLYTAGIVDEDGHPNGLPYPPVGPLTIDDADVAGALFNFLMVEEDRSHGVHNPEYIVDLLESSIDVMEDYLSPEKAFTAVHPQSAH